MSGKILILAVVVVLVAVIATGGFMMLFTNIFGWKDKGGEDAMMNTTQSMPDYEDEAMSSESFAILPTDGDEMIDVDGLFPDSMRDDLKLELILKALELLKTLKKDDVHRWLPRHDEMTEELKLKLILKAILLLKVSFEEIVLFWFCFCLFVCLFVWGMLLFKWMEKVWILIINTNL